MFTFKHKKNQQKNLNRVYVQEKVAKNLLLIDGNLFFSKGIKHFLFQLSYSHYYLIFKLKFNLLF